MSFPCYFSYSCPQIFSPCTILLRISNFFRIILSFFKWSFNIFCSYNFFITKSFFCFFIDFSNLRFSGCFLKLFRSFVRCLNFYFFLFWNFLLINNLLTALCCYCLLICYLDFWEFCLFFYILINFILKFFVFFVFLIFVSFLTFLCVPFIPS